MNKYRGGSQIKLNGKVMDLCPTIDAIVEFEDLVGMSAFEATTLFNTGKGVPLKVLAGAIWSGLYGANSRSEKKETIPTWREVAEMLISEGIGDFYGDVFHYLTTCYASDKDIEKYSGEKKKKTKEK